MCFVGPSFASWELRQTPRNTTTKPVSVVCEARRLAIGENIKRHVVFPSSDLFVGEEG